MDILMVLSVIGVGYIYFQVHIRVVLVTDRLFQLAWKIYRLVAIELVKKVYRGEASKLARYIYRWEASELAREIYRWEARKLVIDI